MKSGFQGLIASFCIIACGTSCVYINEELGNNFIPTEQRYDIYIDEFPFRTDDIQVDKVEDLSGYNSSRITVGAIKNGEITSIRNSAVTLIPASKYDFGEGGSVVRFHFAAAKDTLSYLDEGQRRIIQHINVYPLTGQIKEDQGYVGIDKSNLQYDSQNPAATGVYYDGGDSLSFDFDNTWADGFLKKLQKMPASAYDSVSTFTRDVFPGIYFTSDMPNADGGRINIFNLIIGADLKEYTLSGGYATLKIAGAKFNGKEVKDTTFMFLYGAQDFSITQAATSYYSGETLTPQYALNQSSHKGNKDKSDFDGTKIYIEGGEGYKPVIRAERLRNLLVMSLEKNGIEDPTAVVINKATIVLPFDSDAATDYENLKTFPAVLSPTSRLVADDNKKIVSYAGITDTSSSSENQGDINRSKFIYSPDISYHLQQILALDEYDENNEEIKKDYAEKDIWLLTMSKETEEEEQEGTSEYYDNMMYSMYYNNLYNNYGYGYGGYGYGYGGYGYGGYGYNNYYNYYNMAMYYSAMQNQSSNQSSSTTELDRDRYYDAVLRGPKASPETTDKKEGEAGYCDEARIPYLKITYSVRKK